MAIVRKTEAAKAKRNAEIVRLRDAGAAFPELSATFDLSVGHLRLIVEHDGYAKARAIDRFGLSNRTYSRLLDFALADGRVLALDMMASLDFITLCEIPGLGPRGVREIISMLWAHGVELPGIPVKLRASLEAESGTVENSAAATAPCIWDGWREED